MRRGGNGRRPRNRLPKSNKWNQKPRGAWLGNAFECLQMTCAGGFCLFFGLLIFLDLLGGHFLAAQANPSRPWFWDSVSFRTSTTCSP